MNVKLSVVMSVRNGEAYLVEAMDSVLSQTFSDFEFIILDNGSTDSTGEILAQYSDSRIRVITQEDIGLSKSLHKGILQSKGTFIARQDADDISHPDRFASQIETLESDSELGLLGTGASIFVENCPTDRMLRHPVSNSELNYDILINNPFVHTSVMFRRAAYMDIGGYTDDPQRSCPEDFELWSQFVRTAKVGNLSELLVTYREVPGSMSREGINPFIANLQKFTAENLAYHDGGEVQAVHRDFGKYIHGGAGSYTEKDMESFRSMLLRVESSLVSEGCRAKGPGYNQMRERVFRVSNSWTPISDALLRVRSKLGRIRRQCFSIFSK